MKKSIVTLLLSSLLLIGCSTFSKHDMVLKIDKKTDDIVLEWQGHKNCQYRIDSKKSFPDSKWVILKDCLKSEQNGIIQYEVPFDSKGCLFRVACTKHKF